MDKNKKAIACGVPRNREMKLFENCNSRILTYQSKRKAEAGFKVSGFYDVTGRTGEYTDGDNPTYLDITYGKKEFRKGQYGTYTHYEWDYKDICVAVEAQITIEV